MFSELVAEFIGTFWLVLGGCGSAVLVATFAEVGIVLTGVLLAFGRFLEASSIQLSLSLWAGGHVPARHLASYMVCGDPRLAHHA